MYHIGARIIQNPGKALGRRRISFAVQFANVTNVIWNEETVHPDALIDVTFVGCAWGPNFHIDTPLDQLFRQGAHINLGAPDGIGIEMKWNLEDLQLFPHVPVSAAPPTNGSWSKETFLSPNLRPLRT